MYCKNCGTKKEENSKFCAQCGEGTSIISKEINNSIDSAKNNSWSKKTIKLIIYIILGILVLGIISDRILFSMNSNKSEKSFSSSSQIEEPNFLDGSQSDGRIPKLRYINEVVEGILKEITLPQILDKTTSLINVKAEYDSIHYYYVLSGSEYSQISNESMKKSLIENFCANENSTNLINRGINIKYTYSGNSLEKNIDVTFEKKDCIK